MEWSMEVKWQGISVQLRHSSEGFSVVDLLIEFLYENVVFSLNNIAGYSLL